MAGSSSTTAVTLGDRLLALLDKIRVAYDKYLCDPDKNGSQLTKFISSFIEDNFDNYRNRNDEWFLKIIIILADAIKDFLTAFGMLEAYDLCQENAMFYEMFALFHISEGNLSEADNLYKNGIERNAKPLDYLKNSHNMFLEKVGQIAHPYAKCCLDPYAPEVTGHLVKMMDAKMKKLRGYYKSSEHDGKGKEILKSLKDYSKNNIIEIGDKKYHIEDVISDGSFANVYKTCIEGKPDKLFTLKVEHTFPFVGPWEFYVYRQLDNKHFSGKRSKFGFAHELHIYKDTTVLVCDYLPPGTLENAINSYIDKGTSMDEVVCMYYTIEMLDMLEVLHDARIIHGDFKLDNMMVRYASDKLTVQGFNDINSAWRDQGLCLIDWGKAIDVNLFPYYTEFNGDCLTKGYRCIEMQENRPWIYQTDSYALCANVYMMHHGVFMDDGIEKIEKPDGTYYWKPKVPFKSGWNVQLWEELFSKLLNIKSNESDVMLLRDLKKAFQKHICDNQQRIRKLADLLAKEKTLLKEYLDKQNLRKKPRQLDLSVPVLENLRKKPKFAEAKAIGVVCACLGESAKEAKATGLVCACACLGESVKEAKATGLVCACLGAGSRQGYTDSRGGRQLPLHEKDGSQEKAGDGCQNQG